MTPERWQQIKDVLHGALDHEPATRMLYLSQACHDDDELRREVDSFLATESSIWDFLDSPIFSLHARPSKQTKGQRIGVYTLDRELGAGGMGRVFLAKRTDDYEKQVAIKLLHPGTGSDDIIQRFRRERQTLAHLEHPNIVRLLDGGTTEDGLPYFVAEYIDGEPITTYCDRHRLLITERLRLFRQVCDAVQTAHRSLVVHRDLKPANILVTADGIPKLLDFGIAKLLQPGLDQTAAPITNLIQRPGTPGYISPEQVQGQPITTASDVYGLGVLLYELLCGRPPYPELIYGSLEALQLVANRDPKPPSAMVTEDLEIPRPDADPLRIYADASAETRALEPPRLRRTLRGDLDAIVLQAMQRQPDERYASVEQLREDIDRYLDGFPVVARQASLAYRTRRFLRRNWIGASVIGAIFALVVGFGLREAGLRRSADVQRAKAEEVQNLLIRVLTATEPSKAKGAPVLASDLLRDGTQIILDAPDLDPETRGDLLETIGGVLRKLGDYEDAKRLVEASIQTRIAGLGADHPDVGNGLHVLAGILRAQRDLPAAEETFRQALAIYRNAGLKDNVRRVMSARQSLGVVLSDQGKLTEAIAIYRAVIDTYQQARQPNLDAIDTARSNLAGALVRTGHNREAEGLLKDVLAIRLDVHGTDHIKVALAHTKLAFLYRNVANMPLALEHARASFEIRDLLYEEDHLDFVRGLSTLAIVLHDDNRVDDAISYYQRAEQGFRNLFDAPDSRHAKARANLASALIDLGALEDARTHLTEAMPILRQAYPNGHDSLAGALRHAARLEALDGNAESALAMAEESLAMFTRLLPADDWRVADARSILGECMARSGRHEEARVALRESLDDLIRTRGPEARRVHEARERNRMFLEEA